MDLIKGFKKAFQKKELGYPSTSGFNIIGGRWVMLTDNYTTYIDEGWKKIPYVYGIIDHICQKFSDPPRLLYKEKDRKKAMGMRSLLNGASSGEQFFKAKMLRIKAFEQIDEGHDYYSLMSEPNPISNTEKSFNYERCGYLALTGNSYVYSAVPGIGSNAEKPKQLWNIPSPTCQPIAGSNMNPILGYKVSYYEPDNVPLERMQHVKLANFISQFSSLDEMLVGISPMKTLINTNTQLLDGDNANGVAFQNMAPAGIVNGESNADGLTPEQGLQIQEGLQQRVENNALYKKMLVTPARVHWTKIGFSPVDLQILEFMDQAEKKIAKVYHYPLGLLNDMGEVANQEINSKRLITDAVMPYIRRFDDADTQSVRSWYNDPTLSVMTDLQYFPELSEDMEKIARWLKDCYWLSMEEKRRVMDYEEEYQGTVLVPGNLVPIEDLSGLDLSGGNDLTL